MRTVVYKQPVMINLRDYTSRAMRTHEIGQVLIVLQGYRNNKFSRCP